MFDCNTFVFSFRPIYSNKSETEKYYSKDGAFFVALFVKFFSIMAFLTEKVTSYKNRKQIGSLMFTHARKFGNADINFEVFSRIVICGLGKLWHYNKEMMYSYGTATLPGSTIANATLADLHLRTNFGFLKR